MCKPERSAELVRYCIDDRVDPHNVAFCAHIGECIHNNYPIGHMAIAVQTRGLRYVVGMFCSTNQSLKRKIYTLAILVIRVCSSW